MKWLKRASIVLAVLLAIAAAVPFFVSLDDLHPAHRTRGIGEIEGAGDDKSLKFSLLPVPHITVDGITVGKTQDVTLGKVTVTPAVLSLMSTPKVIRSIELKSLVLTQKALDKIPVWSKSDGTAPPRVRIESIRLDDALVNLDKTSFGPFDARVTLDSKGEPVDALVTTQDGKLKASIKPDRSNYLIDATAKSWKRPAGPAIEFDELIIKGVATLNDADFSQVSAKLYGGTVNGKASAGWQKGLQVKGSFDVNQVELKSLVPLFSPGAKLSGRLNAKPVFSASAADAQPADERAAPRNAVQRAQRNFARHRYCQSGDQPDQGRWHGRRDAFRSVVGAPCPGPRRAQIHGPQNFVRRAGGRRQRQHIGEAGTVGTRQCAGQSGGHQREYAAQRGRHRSVRRCCTRPAAPWPAPRSEPCWRRAWGPASARKVGQAIEGLFNKKK